MTAPILTTTPLGRLTAVRQLAALRRIAEWNKRGLRPTRYAVAMDVWHRGGDRGYPYVALRKLVACGLVGETEGAYLAGRKGLQITDAGTAEIAWWDAHPIEAQEGRR